MSRLRLYLLCSLMLTLGACETINDMTSWLGSDDKKPLPGTRISVLSDIDHVKPDDSLSGTDVIIPPITTNDSWPEAGGAAAGITGNLALPEFKHHDSTKIGEHNGWTQPLYPSPIVAGGIIYAMDAKGYVTAHSAKNIDKILWTNKSAVTEDDADLLGGGLAFDNGHVYVSSGRGRLYALDAANGNELWKETLGVSLRAAPKAKNDKVYVMSVDNQLFAFDAMKGTQLWSHRGANESADFLASATPAITDTVALAPYSSGTVYAIDTVGGQELWNDTLIIAHHNNAANVFSGIGGNPIVKDEVAYTGSSSGFFAGMALLTGRRVWEQNISTLNTPWIADDFIYLLSSDNTLLCLMRADGRVKWVKSLPQYGDEKKHRDPLVWRGPLMANNQLLVTGTHGIMLAFSPKDGTQLATIEVPEGITDAPIIAEGRMYFLTQDAKLHVLY